LEYRQAEIIVCELAATRRSIAGQLNSQLLQSGDVATLRLLFAFWELI
jgi:hypothetical protein